MEKKFKLWSFQSTEAVKKLKSKGMLESAWDTYIQTSEFFKSYKWMAEQLTARKINCNDHAPIWAWHSCQKYENAPTLLDARCLLSDIQIEGGIETIEFECPVQLVLLSSYRVWNTIRQDFFSSVDEPKIDKKLVDRLFKVDKASFIKYDSIQAALPFIKLEWVKAIRKLNLIPGNFSFDEKEKV